MVCFGAAKRGSRRQVDRGGRWWVLDVLHRRQNALAPRYDRGWLTRSEIQFRFRRHEGDRSVTLPVAILAGGKATRLYPLTEVIPKSLVEVAGKPFIKHQIELLRRNHIERVVICLGFLGEQIEKILGDGSDFGLQINYVHDGPRLLGTGGALKRALPILGKAFFVLYGDSFLDIDYACVEAEFVQSGEIGLMTVYRNHGKWDRSNVLFAHRSEEHT